jgi:hypothetical protein
MVRFLVYHKGTAKAKRAEKEDSAEIFIIGVISLDPAAKAGYNRIAMYIASSLTKGVGEIDYCIL